MPSLQNESFLMAKIESTIGTDAVPAAATDAVKVYELEYLPISENTNTQRRPLTGAFGVQEIDVAGAFQAKISCKMYMGGSGTLATAPAWFKMAIPCGWQQDWTAATSQILKPATTYAPGAYSTTADFTGMSSVSLYAYQDDTAGGNVVKIWKAAGCMGSMGILFEMGKPPVISFEYIGKHVAPVDDENPATWAPTFPTNDTTPLACLNVGCTLTPSIGTAHTPVFRKLEIKTNQPILRPDMNDSSGYISALLTTRELTYTLEVEVPTDFDNPGGVDWFGLLKQTASVGDRMILEVGPVGTAGSGNQWALNIPRAGIGKVTPSYADGIMVYTIEGSCATVALATGGDELTITYL